jgi:hypothetical protein
MAMCIRKETILLNDVHSQRQHNATEPGILVVEVEDGGLLG